MKIDGRLLLVFTIALSLIPGVYADSLGGGSTISSTENGHAYGILSSNNDAALSQAIVTSSDINYNNWLDDETGKHVEEALKIVQGSGTYNCVFKKGTTIVNPNSVNHLVPASSSLTATMQLDITNAKEIHAGALARNGEGDRASVDVRILMGSITGYKNSVTATMTKATASQSATSASGNSIMFNSWANNREQDNASPHLDIQGGSVTGYANTVTATMTQATASQSATSASGNRIIFNSWANNRELDNACPSLQVYAGSVTGYTTSEIATKTQATASQIVNYATGSSIVVGTQASQVAGGELANVKSKVTGGYIFLYSDKSTATAALSIPKATASADIKAYGTINVQSTANKPGVSISKRIQNFPTHKLVATVNSEANSIFWPTITSQTWKDLAIVALRSEGSGGIGGHIGVGVWNNDGTWTIGAVENPGGSSSVYPYSYNGGWDSNQVGSRQGLTWPQVGALLSDDSGRIRPGGAYDKIKLIKVSDNTNPLWANYVMNNFRNRGYWVAPLGPNTFDSNTCLDATYDALHAYGANVPDPWPNTFPNIYFGQLNGVEYKWNSEWKTYA